MTSICLRSVGVSGRDRLSTFIEVIFLDEKGAGLLFPTELYKNFTDPKHSNSGFAISDDTRYHWYMDYTVLLGFQP